MTLTWIAPASAGCPATSYILQAGSSPGQSNLANSNVGNATSYVATGVGGGTYYVRVRAANAYGQSAPSNESTLVVGPTTITPPPVGCSSAQCLVIQTNEANACIDQYSKGALNSQQFYECASKSTDRYLMCIAVCKLP